METWNLIMPKVILLRNCSRHYQFSMNTIMSFSTIGSTGDSDIEVYFQSGSGNFIVVHERGGGL